MEVFERKRRVVPGWLLRSNVVTVTGIARCHGRCRGKSSEERNPMSDTRMKYAWRVKGGKIRQEGEKSCRRRVVGSGKPGICS